MRVFTFVNHICKSYRPRTFTLVNDYAPAGVLPLPAAGTRPARFLPPGPPPPPAAGGIALPAALRPPKARRGEGTPLGGGQWAAGRRAKMGGKNRAGRGGGQGQHPQPTSTFPGVADSNSRSGGLIPGGAD